MADASKQLTTIILNGINKKMDAMPMEDQCEFRRRRDTREAILGL